MFQRFARNRLKQFPAFPSRNQHIKTPPLNRFFRILLAVALLATLSPSFAADDATNATATILSQAGAGAGASASTMFWGMVLAAVVLGTGIPLLAIWCEFKKRQSLIEVCHQERMSALEKGIELPPFPSEPFRQSDEASDCGGSGTGLKPALVWLGVGIGTLFFSSKFAAIPLGIGAAYLLYYAIEGRKRVGGGSWPKN